jgi:hypothetical protein
MGGALFFSSCGHLMPIILRNLYQCRIQGLHEQGAWEGVDNEIDTFKRIGLMSGTGGVKERRKAKQSPKQGNCLGRRSRCPACTFWRRRLVDMVRRINFNFMMARGNSEGCRS